MPTAAWQEGIERALAEIERLPYPFPRMRGGRQDSKWHRRRALPDRSLAVDRLSHRIDDAAEPRRGWSHLACGIGDHRAASAPDAIKPRERHQHRVVAGEADHLARNVAAAAGLDHDPRAH